MLHGVAYGDAMGAPVEKLSAAEIRSRYGRVTGTAFRHFPSFPQRYVEVLRDHPVDVAPGVRVERVKPTGIPTLYTAADLAVREFSKKTPLLSITECLEPTFI